MCATHLFIVGRVCGSRHMSRQGQGPGAGVGSALPRVEPARHEDPTRPLGNETTVAACVDAMLRSGRERELVLNPSFRIGGAAAQVATDGVTIVVNMASE